MILDSLKSPKHPKKRREGTQNYRKGNKQTNKNIGYKQAVG